MLRTIYQWILKQCPVVTKILQLYSSQNKNVTFLSDVGGDSFTKNEVDQMENEIVNVVHSWKGDVLDRKDLQVIGCGTIGRVYRYGPVVFKVKIPGIVEKIHTNYTWLYPLLYVFDEITMKQYHLIKRATTLMENIRKQYDFELEASQMLQFQIDLLNANFKLEELCTPVLIPQLCNKNVICMEYIEGIELHKVDNLPLSVIDTFLRFSFANNLLLDTMHLDLHGGNVILRGEQIVVIDFGMTQKSLEKKYKMVFLNIVDSIIKKDVERLTMNFAKTFFIDQENTKDVLKYSKEYYDDLYFNIIHTYHMNFTSTSAEFAMKQYSAIDEWTLTHDVYSNSSMSSLETSTIHMLLFIDKQNADHKKILEPKAKKYIRDLLDICL
jgi:predicted unusual protein kinase regulating ubiquinone biosynthesis (AarF/ABC1/UbiB family)